MNYWTEDLALVEAAALRIEALEAAAEKKFDEVFAAAEASGEPKKALSTQEFAWWMAARQDTDEAWSRRSMVMNAKPEAAGS